MAALILSGNKAAHGAGMHPEINLVHNPATAIQAAVDAAQNSLLEFRLERSGLVPRRAALASVLADARAFCTTARDALKPRLGYQYHLQWDAAGFVRSLAVPTSQSGLRSTVQALQSYLVTNPTHAVPPLNVTVERATELLTAFATAQNGLTDQQSSVATCREARDDAFAALRRRLRGTIKELSQLIPADDARWRDFGFNIPAEPETPEQPRNVTVNNSTPGALLVSCSPVPFADHYRFWTKAVGSNDAPVAVGSSEEPLFQITGLDSNTDWKVYVSAVNRAGKESPLSEPVEADVLAAAA
jgi:hypothetical protein